jgi:DNA-binding beta-propeller fold protein YncE
VAVDPERHQVYVATGNNVVVLAGSPLTVQATINVGATWSALALDPLQQRLYGVSGGGSVMVIDTSTRAVIGSVTGLTINPTDNRIYVSNAFSNTISALSPEASVLATLPGRAGFFANPAGLAVETTTQRLYVANQSVNTVSVHDTLNPGAPIADVTVGSGTLLSSADAVTWTARTLSTTADLLAIAFDPASGRMIATGAAATVLSSADSGATWSVVMTSADALSWSYRNNHPVLLQAQDFKPVQVAYAKGLYVAVGPLRRRWAWGRALVLAPRWTGSTGCTARWGRRRSAAR